MNTSTKIFKDQTALSAVAAFTVPEIGTGRISSKSPVGFIFPNINEISAPENIADSVSNFASVENDQDLLENARQQAARIVAQAENDREMIEKAAFEKGLNEARAQIEIEIAGRVGEQVGDLREQLFTTIEQVSAVSDEITAQAETELVELSLEIAKKIVAREVSLDREIAYSLVRLALGKLHHRSAAEVRLNPKDFDFVETRRGQIGFRGSLTLTADDAISPGGCLIHTETGDIDARIKSQFEEIANGLLGN